MEEGGREEEDDEVEGVEQHTLLVKGFWRSKDSSTSHVPLGKRRDPSWTNTRLQYWLMKDSYCLLITFISFWNSSISSRDFNCASCGGSRVM